jgi:sterol desaturase/sphingolipid hydroxylase (fatty acid hydroxylase superfamily)
MTQIVAMFIALAGLCVLLYGLEWMFPSMRAQPLWRTDSKIDAWYLLFTPFVTRWISKLVALAGVVIALHVLGHGDTQRIADGFGPVIKQPRWLVVAEMFVLGDLLGYWLHRCFHGRYLWKFHAVHHSSTQLDWLSSVRVHPINDIVSKLMLAVPLACLGFPLKALAGYVPFLTFYAILLHANVGWSFGPLRYAIASPLFHRWHHTTEEQGLNRNFAPLFPLIDIAFGTFHMPQGQRPTFLGTIATNVPQSFLGQLVFPFRTHKALSRPAVAS